MFELFDEYPRLSKALARTPIGDFPTPVVKLCSLGERFAIDSLYLKNDGLSAPIYGGNKIRKLEFLLGAAKKKGAFETLTFGYAGSNHAAATAVCARKLGLNPISILLHQPSARYVRQNLLVSAAVNTEIIFSKSAFFSSAKKIIGAKLKKGRAPYVIAPGGSSPLGTIGYVNAAFELKRQIENKALPCPDRIYLPLGSMGTAVGLALGLRAAGLETQIVAVRVVKKAFANKQTFQSLFGLTHNFLKRNDPLFSHSWSKCNNIEIRDDYFGRGYAEFTEEGARAVKLVADLENIQLDGAYTGKAMAALLFDGEAGALKNKCVLFWNTYNANDLSDLVKNVDYRVLPKELHFYFEQDVQPLDS